MYTAGGDIKWPTTLEDSLAVIKKLNLYLTMWSCHSTPRKWKHYVHTKTYSWMSLATSAKKAKPKSPWTVCQQKQPLQLQQWPHKDISRLTLNPFSRPWMIFRSLHISIQEGQNPAWEAAVCPPEVAEPQPIPPSSTLTVTSLLSSPADGVAFLRILFKWDHTVHIIFFCLPRSIISFVHITACISSSFCFIEHLYVLLSAICNILL